MPFDPDTFLKEEEGFDPDAFLSDFDPDEFLKEPAPIVPREDPGITTPAGPSPPFAAVRPPPEPPERPVEVAEAVPPPPGEPLKFEEEVAPEAPVSTVEVAAPPELPEGDKGIWEEVGRRVMKSGKTARELAETDVEGKAREGLGSDVAKYYDYAKREMPTTIIGDFVATGAASEAQREGLKYLNRVMEIEEERGEKRARLEDERQELETALEFKTAEPGATAVIPESDVKLSDLPEIAQQKAKEAKDSFKELAKMSVDVGRGFVGQLIKDTPEYVGMFGMLKKLKQAFNLSKLARQAKFVDDVTKKLKALDPKARAALIADLGAETAILTAPHALEKGELSGEDYLAMAMWPAGFRAAKAGLKKVKEAKRARAPKVTPEKPGEKVPTIPEEGAGAPPVAEAPAIEAASEAQALKALENKLRERGVPEEQVTVKASETYNKMAPEEKILFDEIIGDLSKKAETAKLEAEIDPLTGAKTRQYGKNKGLMELIEKKDERGRPKKSFKVVDLKKRKKLGYDDVAVFDVDGFKKKINDQFGHDVGDDVLIAYFDLLDKHIGEFGDVIRVGGDEGLFIKFANSKKQDILKGVEAARKELGEMTFAEGKLSGVNFTAGYGKDFIPADRQLFRAKEAGRGITFEGGKQYGLQPDRPSGLTPSGQRQVTPPVTKGGKPVAKGVEAPGKTTEPGTVPEKVKEPRFKLGSIKDHIIVRNALKASGEKKVTDKMIRDFIKSGKELPKPKEKRKGLTKFQQAERKRDRDLEESNFIYGNPDVSGQTKIKPSELSGEFKSGLQTFEVLPTKKEGVVKVNRKDAPYSKAFELRADEPIFVDTEVSRFVEAKPTQVTKTGKTVPADVQRRMTGAAGPQEQVKVTADKPAVKYQKMLDWQRRKMKRLGRPSLAKLRDWFGREVVQSEAPLAKIMIKDPQGQKAIMRLQLSRGASGASKIIVDKAAKDIKKNVPHGSEEAFGGLLQAFRTIEAEKVVSKRKGLPMDLYPEGDPGFRSPMGLKGKDAQAYIDAFKNQHPDLYAQVEKGLNKYWDVQRKQVENLYKEGIIDKKFHDYLIKHHKHYNPRIFLKRLDPDTKSIDAGGNKINVPDSGIKALDKGSQDALVSDWEYLLEQSVLRTQTRIFKNRANKSLLEYVESNPDNPFGMKIEKPIGKTTEGAPQYAPVPFGHTRVSAMVQGKRQGILIPDEYAKFWVNTDPQISPEFATALKTMSGTPILKAMATGVNPEFAMTNLPRDIVYTWFKQHEAYNPILPIGMMQMGKEMLGVTKDVILRKGAWKKYMENGGSMDFLTSQGFLFKRKLGEIRGPLSDKLTNLQDLLGYIGNTSEALPRVALMQRLIKQGKSLEEAVWAARTNLDFAQGGRLAKGLDNAFPYLNAGIQGTRGVFQGFKTNPALASFKASQILGLSFGLTYWAGKKYKETMDSISPREKESGWIIPLPFSFTDSEGHDRHPYIKIPKDYGQRVFAAGGQALADLALGNKVDSEELKMSLTDLIPVDAISQIPPTLSAFLTYQHNRDFWRKRDIWTGRKVSPQLEFHEDTPQMWVALGEKTGMSPERLKTATGEIFPENIYTQLMLYAWDQIQMPKKQKSEINKQIFEHMAEQPFSRKILRLTWPERTDDFEIQKKLIQLRKKGFVIDTETEKGNQKSKRKVKREIREAERKVNDLRQQNDMKLRRIMTEEFMNPIIPDKNPEREKLFKESAEVSPAEPKRLVNRYVKGRAAIERKRRGRKDWRIFQQGLEEEEIE